MAVPPKAPSSAQAASPVTESEVMPWWVPQWPQVLAAGLYIMSFWLLWILSPEKGKEPSDLFKALAEAIVLTAFVNGVVAAVFISSRDSQKKNETIAAQAKAIASQPPTS